MRRKANDVGLIMCCIGGVVVDVLDVFKRRVDELAVMLRQR